MQAQPFSPIDLTRMTKCSSPDAAVDLLAELYQQQIEHIKQRFAVYADGQKMDKAAPNGFYPLLVVSVPARQVRQTSMLSMGRIAGDTLHATTVTRPDLFKAYLSHQLAYIKNRFGVDIYVSLSDVPIPITFALEQATANLSPNQKAGLQYFFHLPNLAATNDDIVDGRKILQRSGPLPLSLFTAERVDYSLFRIRHYIVSPLFCSPIISAMSASLSSWRGQRLGPVRLRCWWSPAIVSRGKTQSRPRGRWRNCRKCLPIIWCEVRVPMDKTGALLW